MILEGKIREHLGQLISGGVSLDEFEDWLIAISWNMRSEDDPAAYSLVSFLELRLAEYLAGHLPLAQMIDEFSSRRAAEEAGDAHQLQFNNDHTKLVWLTPTSDRQPPRLPWIQIQTPTPPTSPRKRS